MVKNYSDNLHFIKITEDLKMKQMFEPEKLISEQSDEIYGVNTINWEDSSWKHLSLVGGEKVISLSHTKGLRIFRFCVMLWKDERKPIIKLCMEDRLTWFKSSSEYRALDTIDGEPTEFEWNIFPGFTTLQLVREVQKFLSKMSIQPEDFTGRTFFMSMFNDISWGSKDKKQECESSAQLVSMYAKRFSPGKWSILGPGSEKK